MFLDMPRYAMNPPCLYNYTYSLYQVDEEVLIQEFDLSNHATIVDTDAVFYMDPIETGLFAY
jgi:hypothetical protein